MFAEVEDEDKDDTNNMRKAIILIFSLGLFSTSAGLAAGVWHDDDEVYEATKEACSLISLNDLHSKSTVTKLRAGLFPSKKYRELLFWISKDAAVKAIEKFEILAENSLAYSVKNSEYFQKALNECYPNDSQARQLFETSINDSIVRGKMAVTVTALIIIGASRFILPVMTKIFGLSAKYIIAGGLVLLTIPKIKKLLLEYKANKNLRQTIENACQLSSDDEQMDQRRSECLLSEMNKQEDVLVTTLQQAQKNDEPLMKLLKESARIMKEIEILKQQKEPNQQQLKELQNQHNQIQNQIDEMVKKAQTLEQVSAL